MSQQDVSLILQGLQQGRQAALQSQQLKQQADQFKDSLAQRVAEAKMQHDMQSKQLDLQQTQLERQLAERPDLIQYLPGAQNLGGISGLTTGDPKTETQQNLYQLPLNDSFGHPVTMQAPTPNAYANQIATQKRLEMQPQMDYENAKLAQEHQNRLGEIGLTSDKQKDLEQFLQAQENQRSKLQRDTQIEINRNSQAHEDSRNAATVAASNYRANQVLAGENYRANLQYGPGQMTTDDYASTLHNLFTGKQNLNDPAFKNLKKPEKERITTDLIKMGGVSLSPNQMKALQQVDTLKNIVDQVDEFNRINSDGLIPHIPTLNRIQGQLQGAFGNVAQTLQNEPGRKAGWMVKGAEGTVLPKKFDPFNQNIPRRDAMVKDINDYYDSQLNNLPPEQKAAIKHAYGIDTKFLSTKQIPTQQTENAPKTADDYLKAIGAQ